MAKKIFATPEEIDKFLQDAQALLIQESTSLRKRKFQTDDEREFTLKFKMDEIKDDRRAEVLFTPIAWVKMYALVMKYSSEVEWHGLVERTSDTSWLVKDILIFPHKVTGSTVVSDQREYEAWLNDLDDETFNALRFHGHSHVHMAVTPSSVDMGYRKNVLNNFGTPVEGTDYFYIFLITNKRGELSCQVYDLNNNVLYTNDSTHDEITIDVCYDDGDTYLSEFLAEARSVVKEANAYQAPKSYDHSGEREVPTGCGTTPAHTPYGYGVPSFTPRQSAKAQARQAQQVGIFDRHEGNEYEDDGGDPELDAYLDSLCGGCR